jgi:hypothetical protein
MYCFAVYGHCHQALYASVVLIDIERVKDFSLLLLALGGGRLGFCGSILHLFIRLGLLRLLGLFLSLALGLLFGALLGRLFLLSLQDSLALGLDLLLVPLDDGTSNEADLIQLGNVDGLGSVLALLVEPVLCRALASSSCFHTEHVLTSMSVSLARSLSFSSSLANSA